jgi:hypothetical protein
VQAHEGQVIELAGYRLSVEEIWGGETNGGIKVRVRGPVKSSKVPLLPAPSKR